MQLFSSEIFSQWNRILHFNELTTVWFDCRCLSLSETKPNNFKYRWLSFHSVILKRSLVHFDPKTYLEVPNNELRVSSASRNGSGISVRLCAVNVDPSDCVLMDRSQRLIRLIRSRSSIQALEFLHRTAKKELV